MPWKIETHGEDMLKRFVHEGLRCLMGRDDDDDDDDLVLLICYQHSAQPVNTTSYIMLKKDVTHEVFLLRS